MSAEASRKPLNNDVLFEILRDLNPTPEQRREIDVLETLILARKTRDARGKVDDRDYKRTHRGAHRASA